MRRTLSSFDSAFPSGLRDLAHPPSHLHVSGCLPSQPGITIVGTRAPSDEALHYARDLAFQLAKQGLVVWSGGAMGIDSAAHEGALAAGGSTVIVAGSGLGVSFPLQRRTLFEQVQATGAIVSVFPDLMPARPWTFLARNHILAAATSGTVVVECPWKSGARSTSAAARRIGRPVWFVAQAPWSPVAATMVDEIRRGAIPLFEITQLLQFFNKPTNQPTQLSLPSTVGTPARKKAPRAALSPLTETLFSLLKQSGHPLHSDTLCDQSGLPSSEVHYGLTLLLVQGWVKECLPGHFQAVTI